MDWVFLIAFLGGFAATFIGAIGGGVGLALRPLLIFLGYPVATIISTVRVAGYAGDLPSLAIFTVRKRVDWKLAAFLMVPSLVGVSVAAFLTISLFEGNLRTAFAVLLLIMGGILIANKRFGVERGRPKFAPWLRHTVGFVGTVFITLIGTLTGGLGPLFSTFYVWLYGKTYIDASALWRAAWYVGGGVGTLFFVVSGIVDWQLCLALALGMIIGSYTGTQYGLKKGETWARGLILLIVIVTAIKLLFL